MIDVSAADYMRAVVSCSQMVLDLSDHVSTFLNDDMFAFTRQALHSGLEFISSNEADNDFDHVNIPSAYKL